MTDSPRPTVAIVVPVFNEEPVLPELFARLEALFAAPAECAWRAVFVDDGSRDRSAELLRAQGARDSRFELVELSRNFGFQSALAAGLAPPSGRIAAFNPRWFQRSCNRRRRPSVSGPNWLARM